MLEQFQADLRVLDGSQMFRKHILDGACHILDQDLHFKLREEICRYFSVGYTEVIVVGSAKLGFSIKPSKRFGLFNDESDIDVAIVSMRLFTRIWEEAFLYKKGGAYWPKGDEFFKYLSQGWIRPDKLPRSPTFQFTSEWWDFFSKLTSSRAFGPYKIRGALYCSMFFLEEYQKICVEQCMAEVVYGHNSI